MKSKTSNGHEVQKNIELKRIKNGESERNFTDLTITVEDAQTERKFLSRSDSTILKTKLPLLLQYNTETTYYTHVHLKAKMQPTLNVMELSNEMREQIGQCFLNPLKDA